MRYHVLATDFDGTLALRGRVDAPTLAALERLLASGRKLILVTGRELDELLGIFPEMHLFALVVAENGALIYEPASKQITLLAEAPPADFVAELTARGVAPVSAGRVIVATWRPHEAAVLATIGDRGLDYQVIFNKDAVMMLPSGINKASGLTAALAAMGLTVHEAAGIGDAENDLAFLALCECSAAVDNALPAVKERSDLVTRGDHGAGVIELIDMLIADDVAGLDVRLTRHHLDLGTRADGSDVWLSPYGYNLLVAGPSGSGKTTAATAVLERLSERGYQYCIIDPEGDYENLDGAVTLGGAQRGPTVDEAVKLLGNSRNNAVINLVGLPLADRPPFFLSLLPRLQELRARTGRPHWLVVDEAHHLLPASWEPSAPALAQDLRRVLFITVHPDQVARAALAGVTTLVAVGGTPEATVSQFYSALGERQPAVEPLVLQEGEVFLWSRDRGAGERVKLRPSKIERRRHIRKYSEGELPPDRSFYFRGPAGKLNLRAQNLILFLQLADGVDDETWTYHLRNGDYSLWFRERIKDDTLADEAAEVERKDVSPVESRALLRAVVERHYTQPAGPPLPMPGTDAAPRHEPT